MKKIFSILLISIFLFAFSGCSPDVQEEDSLYYTEAGRAIKYGEYIYYINGAPALYIPSDFYHTTAGALYRMKEDGTEKQVVLSMITTIFTVDNDRIYFVAMNTGDTFIIGSCAADGTDYKELGDFDSGVFQYTRGGLYFSSGGMLAYMDLSGKHKNTIIPVSFQQYMMGEQHIFYTYTDENDNGYLYCVDPQGKHQQTLLEGQDVTLLAADGSEIYFASDTDGRIYSIDAQTNKQKTILYTSYESWLLDIDNDRIFGAGDSVDEGITRTSISSGETVKLLQNVYATDMTLGKDTIYFLNQNDNGYLYRISVDGGIPEKMSEQTIYNEQLKEIDNYLYFIDDDTLHLYRIELSSLITEDITVKE